MRYPGKFEDDIETNDIFERRRPVRLSRMKVLMLWMMMIGGAAEAAAKNIMIAYPSASSRMGINRDQEFQVVTTPETLFVRDQGPCSFADILIGMPVMVEGRFPADAPGVIIANTVHLSSHPPHDNAANRSEKPLFESKAKFAMHGPNPMTDHVGGPVDSINEEESTFTVFMHEFAGQLAGINVPDDVPIRQAFIGEPLIDIDFEDLHPGDPMMINVRDDGDFFVATYMVRSNDWLPEGAANGLNYDLYGHIHEIWHGPLRGLTLEVETTTGEPNHQEFSFDVGPSGGMLYFPWGYVNIPEGALEDWRTITVAGEFMFTWTLRNEYSFEPRTQFLIPITLEIRYFNLDGINPENVNLSYYDEESGRWRVAGHMIHYPEDHAFRGEITHFSRYSLSVNGKPVQQAVEQ
jgi:hypothetical protein